VKGFNWFYPGLGMEQEQRQAVTITSIKVFDHNISFDSTQITLPHNENYLSFEFAAQSHYRTQDNQYSYMLEGDDKDWIFAGSRRYVTYTNLSPGNYIFHVRIAGSGSASLTETSIPILIKPPWHRTPFALVSFAIVGALIVYAGFRMQHARVVHRERAAARMREAELKNIALEEKNLSAQRELDKAKELEQAYDQLKMAQEQLVQQEKLASLGHLTAGIAHEIKNPLNFVTNFSEGAAELVDELRNAISEEERSRLSDDLQQNLDKVVKHSKRADSIVKNMLLHSKTGSGEKQPTDINALCEEFIHLAFHGMRANHTDFNSEIEKNFSAELPRVNIVAQDIGRVLLNLFSNAFFAVYERDKMESAARFHKVQEIAYQPKVSVSTGLKDRFVMIQVYDNGSGISDGIRQKVFDPFFTTKAPGTGTGLGLSLSHDIIKAHGGTISVESRVNEYTTFTVKLPL